MANTNKANSLNIPKPASKLDDLLTMNEDDKVANNAKVQNNDPPATGGLNLQ